MKNIKNILIIILAILFISQPVFSSQEQPNVDFGSYMKNLQNKIKKNWNPPNEKGRYARATVLFTLDKNGKLIKYNIKKSSGIKEYDKAAIKALKSSSPFDALPKEYKEETVDIQFNFDYMNNLH